MKFISVLFLLLFLISCSSEKHQIDLESSIVAYIKDDYSEISKKGYVVVVKDYSDEFFESYLIYAERINIKDFSNVPMAIGNLSGVDVLYYCESEKFCDIEKYHGVVVDSKSEIVDFIKSKGWSNLDLVVSNHPIPAGYFKSRKTGVGVFVDSGVYDQIKRVELFKSSYARHSYMRE